MSTFSQFLGGDGVPVGGFMPWLANQPPYLTAGTQEYLKAGGAMVSYEAKYDAALRANELLGRRGQYISATGLVGGGTSSYTGHGCYVYDGTNYHFVQFSENGYPVDSTATAIGGTWTNTASNALGGVAHSGSTIPPRLTTTNGSGQVASFGLRSVYDGGLDVYYYYHAIYTRTGTGAYTRRVDITSDETNIPTATFSNIAFNGSNKWLVIAYNTAYYINAANCDASWSSGAVSGVSIYASYHNTWLTGNASVWVLLKNTGGGSADVYTSTNNTTWTSRTLPATITGSIAQANYRVPVNPDICWSGTDFLAPVINTVTGAVRLLRSSDGTTWTLDSSDVGLFAGTTDTSAYANIATDRNGKILVCAGVAKSTTTYGRYSSDNGSTWSSVYLGGAVSTYAGGIDYVNGEFIASRVAFVGGSVPYYMGVTPTQITAASPQLVGIPETIFWSNPSTATGIGTYTGVPAYVRIR